MSPIVDLWRLPGYIRAMSTPGMASSPAAPATVRVPLWIDGKKIASTGGRDGEGTNAATGQVVRTVPFANAEDVDRAVKAAVAAFPAWRAATTLRRARNLAPVPELVEQHQEEIAALI